MLLSVSGRRRTSAVPVDPGDPVDPGLAADPDATLYALPTAPPYNTPSAAITPTYDGSGEACHPSVIDFHQVPEVDGDWNGWRYWMVQTPYPDNDKTKENPSILVSNNGFYWTPPPGLARNPLYFPTNTIGMELSDPHLVYEPDRDGLLLLYRDNGLNWAFLLARSSDGLNWPAASTEMQFTRAQQVVSPSLIRHSPTDWRIFGLYRDARTLMMWRASDPYGTWEGPYPAVGITYGGLWAWHLDVRWDGSQYLAVFDRGSVQYPDGYRAATSSDGIVWKMASSDFMTNSAEGWDSRELYRPVTTPHENGLHSRLWYTGNALVGTKRVWGVGYSQVPNTIWPDAPALTPGSGTVYRDAVLADSPEVYWRMGDDYDATATADASGNGRSGTWLAGSGIGRSTGLVPDADYSTTVFNATATRAAEAWMGAASYTAEAVIDGTPSAGVIVGVDSADARGWYLAKRGSYLRWESPGDGLLLERYNVPTKAHVAVTVGAGQVQLWVNGAVVSTLAATPSAPPAAAPLTVARGPYGAFAGVVDEVAVYTGVLSSARILAHAQAAGLA